jgi:ribosomal protein L11 methyltransferase
VRWLEVSLAVSTELAEAVADILARFAPQGVAMSYEAGATPGSLVVVRAYLPEAAADASERRRLEESLWHLSQIQPLPEPSTRWIEEDWAEAWKANYRPLAVGSRLLIVPAWLKGEDPDRIPLYLDPGMAFGTGAHPTTRLCLVALEAALTPGDLVVDLGCGSGILGVAAALLGAGQVLACDIDADALAATERSAERNGVRRTIEIIPGSLAQVEERLRAARRAADIVVANILAPVLQEMLATGLAETLRPGGTLILSGILAEQSEGVKSEGRNAGLALAAEESEGEWRALILRR